MSRPCDKPTRLPGARAHTAIATNADLSPGSVRDNESFYGASLISKGDCMSGQVIPFQGRRFHGRVVADVETHVERQLARIASLVDELEALTCNTMNLAPGLIARAHDTMERARGVLSSLGGGDEQDPQPDVDRELLARLYREVNPTK